MDKAHGGDKAFRLLDLRNRDRVLDAISQMLGDDLQITDAGRVSHAAKVSQAIALVRSGALSDAEQVETIVLFALRFLRGAGPFNQPADTASGDPRPLAVVRRLSQVRGCCLL